MKLSKSTLKHIIQEELNNVLKEYEKQKKRKRPRTVFPPPVVPKAKAPETDFWAQAFNPSMAPKAKAPQRGALAGTVSPSSERGKQIAQRKKKPAVRAKWISYCATVAKDDYSPEGERRCIEFTKQLQRDCHRRGDSAAQRDEACSGYGSMDKMFKGEYVDPGPGTEEKGRRRGRKVRRGRRKPRFMRKYRGMASKVGTSREAFKKFYAAAQAKGLLTRRRDRDYIWGRKHQRAWDKLNAAGANRMYQKLKKDTAPTTKSPEKLGGTPEQRKGIGGLPPDGREDWVPFKNRSDTQKEFDKKIRQRRGGRRQDAW